MANKNLMKRAFSVTANLPALPQSDEVTQIPNVSTPSTKLQNIVATPTVEPSSVAYPADVTVAPAAPKTGPGSMLAFMTEQSEVHKEVVKLRERVTEFEGADVARKIDARQVKPSKWANRDDAHFVTAAFARLKEEISNSVGNVQPIKVRPLVGKLAGEAKWEIVYGHRRHRACLELGIPVFALVQQEMADSELFVEMERENRQREDLSAWEQGVMYMRALEQGLFPSAKQLAAAIDRDMSNISRAMALAKLPREVIKAFGSPLNLQFRWAKELKDAHQRDPEGLLATARELASRPSSLSPSEVFSILTSSGQRKKAVLGTISEWKDSEGNRLAVLTCDRNSKLAVSFDQAMDEAHQRRLEKLLDGFFMRKV